jgi:hypothetical protein
MVILFSCWWAGFEYSGDQVKKNEVGVARGTYERQGKQLQDFMGKPEGKKPLGRPRLR